MRAGVFVLFSSLYSAPAEPFDIDFQYSALGVVLSLARKDYSIAELEEVTRCTSRRNPSLSKVDGSTLAQALCSYQRINISVSDHQKTDTLHLNGSMLLTIYFELT